MQSNESLKDALTELKDKGYKNEFEAEPFCLYCSDLDMRLNPDEFHVDAIYNFEEQGKSEDNAIVYAISSAHGIKGLVVDPSQAISQHWNFDMAKKLRYQPVTAKP
jgi:hypothetical protein